MREILFRGKCFINDKWEWVYGYYAPVYLFSKDGKEDNTYCIISDKYIGRTEMLGCGVQSGLPANYMIKKETLGQYTGHKDKNGTKIFEGDICKHRSNYSGDFIISVVTYTDGCFLAMADNNSGFALSDKLEIISNIYDNPELLEVDNG